MVPTVSATVLEAANSIFDALDDPSKLRPALESAIPVLRLVGEPSSEYLAEQPGADPGQTRVVQGLSSDIGNAALESISAFASSLSAEILRLSECGNGPQRGEAMSIIDRLSQLSIVLSDYRL